MNAKPSFKVVDNTAVEDTAVTTFKAGLSALAEKHKLVAQRRATFEMCADDVHALREQLEAQRNNADFHKKASFHLLHAMFEGLDARRHNMADTKYTAQLALYLTESVTDKLLQAGFGAMSPDQQLNYSLVKLRKNAAYSHVKLTDDPSQLLHILPELKALSVEAIDLIAEKIALAKYSEYRGVLQNFLLDRLNDANIDERNVLVGAIAHSARYDLLGEKRLEAMKHHQFRLLRHLSIGVVRTESAAEKESLTKNIVSLLQTMPTQDVARWLTRPHNPIKPAAAIKLVHQAYFAPIIEAENARLAAEADLRLAQKIKKIAQTSYDKRTEDNQVTRAQELKVAQTKVAEMIAQLDKNVLATQKTVENSMTRLDAGLVDAIFSLCAGKNNQPEEKAYLLLGKIAALKNDQMIIDRILASAKGYAHIKSAYRAVGVAAKNGLVLDKDMRKKVIALRPNSNVDLEARAQIEMEAQEEIDVIAHTQKIADGVIADTYRASFKPLQAMGAACVSLQGKVVKGWSIFRTRVQETRLPSAQTADQNVFAKSIQKVAENIHRGVQPAKRRTMRPQNFNGMRNAASVVWWLPENTVRAVYDLPWNVPQDLDYMVVKGLRPLNAAVRSRVKKTSNGISENWSWVSWRTYNAKRRAVSWFKPNRPADNAHGTGDFTMAPSVGN